MAQLTLEQAKIDLETLKKQRDNFDKSEHVNEDEFDDNLNSSEEWTEVCGLSFAPSDILRELDPTAYRCAFNDWIDSLELEEFDEYRDLEEQIEELEEEIEDIVEADDEHELGADPRKIEFLKCMREARKEIELNGDCAYFGCCEAISNNFQKSSFRPWDLRYLFSRLYQPDPPDLTFEFYWLAGPESYWNDGLKPKQRRLKYLKKFKKYLLTEDRWKDFLIE